MFDRKTIIAMLLVYLLISFMPSLSLMSLLGKAGGGKKGPGQ
jgi:hypothetical protein